jgi:hypothetical protein
VPEQVSTTSDEKLNQPLLQFHDDATPDMPLLAVNFDPALVRLLRETKYFLLLKISVPDAAAVLFQSADTFRQQIGALDLMVGLYNKVQRTILAVEKPLVQQKLEAVEAALKRGLEELNWRTGGIDTYIRESLEAVKDVDMILTTIKDNVRNTQVSACAGRSHTCQWALALVRPNHTGAPSPVHLHVLSAAVTDQCSQPYVQHDQGTVQQHHANCHAALLTARCTCCLQDILSSFEKNLMFDRKEGKVYTYDELNDASAALISQRHAEMRDAGKEIGKLLSSSNRVLKVCSLPPCLSCLETDTYPFHHPRPPAQPPLQPCGVQLQWVMHQ